MSSKSPVIFAVWLFEDATHQTVSYIPVALVDVHGNNAGRCHAAGLLSKQKREARRPPAALCIIDWCLCLAVNLILYRIPKLLQASHQPRRQHGQSNSLSHFDQVCFVAVAGACGLVWVVVRCFSPDVFGGEPCRADVACWGGWGPHTPCARQIGPHPPQPTPPSRHGSLRCVWGRRQQRRLLFAAWLHRFARFFLFPRVPAFRSRRTRVRTGKG